MPMIISRQATCETIERGRHITYVPIERQISGFAPIIGHADLSVSRDVIVEAFDRPVGELYVSRIGLTFFRLRRAMAQPD